MSIRVSVTFLFVSRVNCVHHSISHDLHLSLFGTETFSSAKGQFIFWTHFNYFILSTNRRNIDMT